MSIAICQFASGTRAPCHSKPVVGINLNQDLVFSRRYDLWFSTEPGASGWSGIAGKATADDKHINDISYQRETILQGMCYDCWTCLLQWQHSKGWAGQRLFTLAYCGVNCGVPWYRASKFRQEPMLVTESTILLCLSRPAEQYFEPCPPEPFVPKQGFLH
jgi:hypothetical protein